MKRSLRRGNNICNSISTFSQKKNTLKVINVLSLNFISYIHDVVLLDCVTPTVKSDIHQETVCVVPFASTEVMVYEDEYANHEMDQSSSHNDSLTEMDLIHIKEENDTDNYDGLAVTRIKLPYIRKSIDKYPA